MMKYVELFYREVYNRMVVTSTEESKGAFMTFLEKPLEQYQFGNQGRWENTHLISKQPV
jgi:hypothetical protein